MRADSNIVVIHHGRIVDENIQCEVNVFFFSSWKSKVVVTDRVLCRVGRIE
jgi:hypothetical protein